MTNIKLPKTNQQLLDKLQADNSILVIETINQLRNSGNSAYIPELVNLMLSTSYPEVKTSIISLLSELKMKDAVHVLVEAIQEPKNISIKKDLVAVCWENGLDFGSYLSFFVDMVIECDFGVSFEAYTVIMNLPGTVTSEDMNREIEKMEAVLHQVQPDKKQLLIDMIDFLPTISQ